MRQVKTYFRRQHGQVCFDAAKREAKLPRQSSHSARHLQEHLGRRTLTERMLYIPTRPTNNITGFRSADHTHSVMFTAVSHSVIPL